jgi:hypothetical protein
MEIAASVDGAVCCAQRAEEKAPKWLDSGGLSRRFESHEFAPHRHRPGEADAPCYEAEQAMP